MKAKNISLVKLVQNIKNITFELNYKKKKCCICNNLLYTVGQNAVK